MTIQELRERLELPVIVSPMFLVSGTKLVIECCKNGVLGCFPSLNGRKPEDFEQMLIEIEQELKRYEQTTGKKAAPYGVNIIVNKTNPRVMTDLQLCIKYKVPVVITSLGAVKELVEAVHGYGGLVFHDIVKKRHAEKALEAGVDGIIAVSAGAGGHAGIANPFALMSELRSFYDGTIILAGAINSGKDILAAQTLSADFVYMGTHFIASQESMAGDAYKEMLLQSSIDDVIYTPAVSGVNANFLKKSIEIAGIDLNHKKAEDFSKLSTGHEAKAWKDIWSAGQGVTAIRQILPVNTIIETLKSEYKIVLQQQLERINRFFV